MECLQYRESSGGRSLSIIMSRELMRAKTGAVVVILILYKWTEHIRVHGRGEVELELELGYFSLSFHS